MSAPLLTRAEIREVIGAKADRMSDAEIDALARRIRGLSRVILETQPPAIVPVSRTA